MVRLFRRIKNFFSEEESENDVSSDGDLVQMANELLNDMESELADMRASLNKQIASEKRLNRKLTEAKEESEQREQDAIDFLENDQEQSARMALLKKEEADRYVQEVSILYQSAQAHKKDLLKHIDDQLAEYDRLQSKKNELQSKRNQGHVSPVGNREPTVLLEKETPSDHLSDSSGEGHDGNLDQQEKKSSAPDFSQISSLHQDSGVEAKLAVLKKSLKQKELGE